MVKIIATGEKSKAMLRSQGIEPGKITSSVTTRSKGSSLRVTRSASGVLQNVQYIGSTGKLSSSDKSIVNRLNTEVNLREQSRRDAVAKKVIDDINASRMREAQRQARLQAVRNTNISGQFVNRQLELLRANQQLMTYQRAPVSSSFKQSIYSDWAKNFSYKPVSQPQNNFGTVNVNGVVFAPTSNRERQFLKLLNKRILRDERIKKSWNDSINRNRFLVKKGNRWYIKAGQGVVTAGLGLIYTPAFILNGFDKFVVGVAGGLTNVELRRKAFFETKRSVKSAPREVWDSIDPRKPENWGNLLLIATSIVQTAAAIRTPRAGKVKPIVKDVIGVEKKVNTARRYVAKARNVPKSIRNGLKNVLNRLRSEKSRLKSLEKDFIRDLKRTSSSDFKKALSQAKKTDPKTQAKNTLKSIKANKLAEKKAFRRLSRIERQVSKRFKKELSKNMKKLLINRRSRALEEYNLAKAKAVRRGKGLKKAVKTRRRTLKAKKKLARKLLLLEKKLFRKELKGVSKSRARAQAKKFKQQTMSYRRSRALEEYNLAKAKAVRRGKDSKRLSKAFRRLSRIERQVSKRFKKELSKNMKKLLINRRSRALEEYNLAKAKAVRRGKGLKKAVKTRRRTLKAKKNETKRINKLLVSKRAARVRARAGKELRIAVAKEYFRLLKLEITRVEPVSTNKVVLSIEPVISRPTASVLPVKKVVISKPMPVASRGGGNALAINRFPGSAGFSEKTSLGDGPFGNMFKRVNSGGQQLIVIQEEPVTIPRAFRVKRGTVRATNSFYKSVSVLAGLSLKKQLFVIPRLKNSLVAAYRLGLLGLFDVRVVSKLAIKTATKTATRTATKTATRTATKTATRTATKTATRTITDTVTKLKTRQIKKLKSVLRKARKRIPKRVLFLLPRLKFKPRRSDVLFVVNWLKSVPREYRPSLIAIFLDITDDKLPSDITGLGIRPVIVSKRRSKVKRVSKSSKNKKRSKRR